MAQGVDLAAFNRDMASVQRNISFGIARGLTQLAKDASAEITADLPSIFDKPTPFTQRGIGFQPARRDNLSATVFIKDVQAGYLAMQETGGVRIPQPGSPITQAVSQRTNAYGNIPRGAIGREKSKSNTFVASGDGPTAHLAPGLYRRQGKRSVRRDGKLGRYGRLTKGGSGKGVGGRKAKGATTLKLLVAFRPQAKYQPRFRFKDRIEAKVEAKADAVIGASIESAIQTAR